MNVVTVLEKIFDPANGYENFLPEGKDGDGISRQHFQGARKRVGALIEEYKKLQEKSRKLFYDFQTEINFQNNSEDSINSFNAFEENRVKERKMEAKLNRWLGYFQSLIVTNGGASLDEMKLINKNS